MKALIVPVILHCLFYFHYHLNLPPQASAASDRAAAASEDMPVPSSGNEADIRRALSRVEAANNEERVLNQRVSCLLADGAWGTLTHASGTSVKGALIAWEACQEGQGTVLC